ncbi:MAG: hypothetical protein ABEN55_15515 [Bradymonadaceae bacterium]
MARTIDLDIETEEAERLVEQIEDELRLTRDEKLELADGAWWMINRQTGQGLDMHGQPFEPYSDEYIEFLIERGEADSAGGITVDLLLEGHMRAAGTSGAGLDALSSSGSLEGPVEARAEQFAIIISFTSRREAMKAEVHHEGIGVPARPWFNIPAESDRMERLTGRAVDMMAERIERLG